MYENDILKVIHDLDGRCDAFLVKYNGRTGICHDWKRYNESSEDFKHFYSMNDTDSFEDCDISKGENYDIIRGMVRYQLEEIWEKSTERICWN